MNPPVKKGGNTPIRLRKDGDGGDTAPIRLRKDGDGGDTAPIRLGAAEEVVSSPRDEVGNSVPRTNRIKCQCSQCLQKRQAIQPMPLYPLLNLLGGLGGVVEPSPISLIRVPVYHFGNNWHNEKPLGLVVDNYLMRKSDPKNVKSIVNPRYLKPDTLPSSVHDFSNLVAIGEIIDISSLRINHYFTKSTSEFRLRNKLRQSKAENGEIFNTKNTNRFNATIPESYNQVFDNTILLWV